MTAYTFVAEDSRGSVICEKPINAASESEARKQFWGGMTEAQRNSCASVECVDEQDA